MHRSVHETRLLQRPAAKPAIFVLIFIHAAIVPFFTEMSHLKLRQYFKSNSMRGITIHIIDKKLFAFPLIHLNLDNNRNKVQVQHC